MRAGDLLQLKEKNCYTTLISVETLPHYEKVYNFDIADNDNYYVTEDGILVHNGYGDKADDLAKNKSADDLNDVIDDFDPQTATNKQKGNFGEMVTDKDMMEKGFTSLHECVNDLDAPTRIFEYGID